MRPWLPLTLLLLTACGAEELPPEEPPRPAAPAMSLTPTPAKLRAVIALMDKDAALEEETALVEYAKDQKARKDVIDELIAATSHPSAKVRGHVCRVFELMAERLQLREERIVDAVLPLLDDPDLWVPVKAADALGKLKHPKAIPVLLTKLEDKAPERAEAARQGLVTLTGQNLKGAAAWKKWWAQNQATFQIEEPKAN